MVTKQLFGQAIDCARETANFIREHFGQTTNRDIEEKSRNSLVSYVDKEAERQLVKKLSTLLPESGFICEEGTVEPRPLAKAQWVIDPLDGTTNFLQGIPHFAISIGLQIHGVTQLGIVVDVMREKIYASYSKLNCVQVNGVPVKPVRAHSLADSVLATGFAYEDFEVLDKQLQVVGQLVRRSRGVRRMGAAALDLAYVSTGSLQGFFEYALQPYDVCAGAFLVQQAGGIVTDFRGGQSFQSGETITAACKKIHPILLQLIKQNSLDTYRRP